MSTVSNKSIMNMFQKRYMRYKKLYLMSVYIQKHLNIIQLAIYLSIYLKPGLHFERKSTAHMQTILRTWGAFSRPPMPIYAVGIAQVPSVNTPTIRRVLSVDAGLSLVNSPQPMRIHKLLRDIK